MATTCNNADPLSVLVLSPSRIALTHTPRERKGWRVCCRAYQRARRHDWPLGHAIRANCRWTGLIITITTNTTARAVTWPPSSITSAHVLIAEEPRHMARPPLRPTPFRHPVLPLPMYTRCIDKPLQHNTVHAVQYISRCDAQSLAACSPRRMLAKETHHPAQAREIRTCFHSVSLVVVGAAHPAPFQCSSACLLACLCPLM
ncbi:unnamed protein product [Periconia digitata]|uniref:Uncharacterized protein n=1 Tax=Periconia digitata TaxID=1303443 RepID=A0A9W4USB5_9PLEO|nr:unnamed protein product [Periconia digitata]